ncbi:hypothetical protein CHS0354_009229 [Potamilus streckersoni]|uniref:Uncharacterized protein n=1 Tax=Potamilus streckersoni TaxID=2493646 RepID=A0AAE0S6R6_9BIVA|nr:hypothetical protein CHS0354_009229 [Potamilus streckersoni]
MKNCDFKQVLKLIIACFVLSQISSLDTAAIPDCPPQQVLHFNPETNTGICCIPVLLPKGFGFKRCTRNGTHDTIEVCPKEPSQLYQWDNTTTATEATCTAEMQCIDMENRKIKKCDGQNCYNVCVCNYPEGYCGTEYFNCNPFPVNCPKHDVQEDCSCRSPGLEPEKKSGKSNPDLPNTINPIASDSKLPSSSASGKSDKKIEVDQTPDAGVMKENDNTNNTTVSEMEPEESLSLGSVIGITIAVIAVIGGLLFVYICHRYKWLWNKCNRANKESVQLKPIQKVKPFNQNSSEDPDEESQSLQREVTGQNETVGQQLVVQPFLSEDLPQDANGLQNDFLEEPQLNLSVDWPTLGSSLFNSNNRIANQQESGGDQTHVKIINATENVNEEEGHYSG